MSNVKRIARFSSRGVFYRAEIYTSFREICYRVSEVAPPAVKQYRYIRVPVIKRFNKVRIHYKKIYYDYFVLRHNFLGKVNGKAVFDPVGRVQQVQRFFKLRVEIPYVKTKVYTKVVKKRVFVPRRKFHEFRNSFEFKTKSKHQNGVLYYPKQWGYYSSECHLLLKQPAFIQAYENTQPWDVVNPDPPKWYDDVIPTSGVYGLVPDQLGYSELVGASLVTDQYQQVIQSKFLKLNKWVKEHGLSDETKRFLSDELNHWPFYTPFNLPFFNRQDQIYDVDESRGVLGFSRGLSALRADYINYFKSNVHGGTFLGESPEAFKMFLEIIQKLATVLIAAKRGNFKTALSTLGLTSKKGVASNWLMVQYGIKPLISDLKTLAAEASRKETKFHKFHSREFRKFSLELPINWDVDMRLQTHLNVWSQVIADEHGEFGLDKDCYNIITDLNFLDVLRDGGLANHTLPPLPHDYSRTYDPVSDWDMVNHYHTYIDRVYCKFWARRLDYEAAALHRVQSHRKQFSPFLSETRDYTLQRNYVLRTRTPAKYKWWEVLKLNELDLTLWELLPFSFVLDWFIPVGNYLEELASSRSVPRNIKFDLTIKDIVTDKKSGHVHTRCDRMRDIDSTKSAFLNLESISWDPIGHLNIDRLLNAAALLQQLKK